MRSGYIFLASLLLLASVALVRAHGSGVAMDKTIGEYTANMDYDALNGIVTGDPVQFTFQLFNKDQSKLVDFADVWVTIAPTSPDSKYAPPAFDGGILGGSQFAPAGMTFVFPKSGSYTLTARYDAGEKSIVEAVFPLEVAPPDDGSEIISADSRGFRVSSDYALGALTVLLLELLAWLAPKIFRRKRS